MIFSRKRSAIDSTTLFFRQMAALISSGVPLQEALKTLGNENESVDVKNLITQISDNLDAGQTTDKDLAGYPDYFKKILRYSILNKVSDTDFSKVLYELADDNEKMEVFNSRLKGALYYPLILLLTSVVIVGVILLFVIPVFDELFISFASSLPKETQLVIALSRALKANFMACIGFVVIVLVVIKRNKRIFYTIVNLLPGYGKIAKQVSIIKFLRYLSMMMTLKAPIEEAIVTSAEALENVVYAGKLKKASQSIKETTLNSEAFEQTQVFSKMVLRMMDAGEKAGTFDATLAGIATYYEKNLQSMDKTLAVFENVMMIVVGSIIGFLVIAMYMPIFRVASLV